MRDLIERLEKATGPSFVLDAEIWCAVNGYEFDRWDGAGCLYRDHNAPKWERGIKHADASLVRPYTASIDTVVSLTERCLPNWYWSLNVDGMAVISQRGSHDIFSCNGRKSPAIALCIALLRALDAQVKT